MPLDAHEEAQFHRIVTQLREEDPSLGRPRLRERLDTLGQLQAIVVLVVALAALPVALISGLYPVGLLGYLAATLAAVRLADERLARAATEVGPEPTDEPTAEDAAPAASSFPRAARAALLAGAAAIVFVAISPATGGGSAPAPVDRPEVTAEVPGGEAEPGTPRVRHDIERRSPSTEASP